MELDKILLIDKPKGWTSFDVVAKVRGVMQSQYKAETGEKRKIKVGHCGTLDPLATGLLVILTGKNTKKATELTKLNKTYEVEMTLGATSTTGDAEGTLSETKDARSKILELNEAEVKEVISGFLGEISQIPPIYSAIKINGQRAYKLAREGKKVDMPSRQVTIYNIISIKIEDDKVTFSADVSSGTYIRTLVEDIGAKLGTGAYMSGLHRTKIGDFSIKEAKQIEELVLA